MNIEIEARYIDVDPKELVKKAVALGGKDTGEHLLEETIFYDKDLSWSPKGRYARIRSYNGRHVFTHKQISGDTIDGAEEIEFTVDDPAQLKAFLEKMELVPFRVQQKKRHKIIFDGVVLDIDSWPLIPPMLEIEGDSVEQVKEMAEKLGFNWDDALFIDPKKIIENYGHDVSNFRYFTFDKCE